MWRVLFASSEAHQIWEGRWSIRSVMVGEKLKASTGVSLQWLTAFWQNDTFPHAAQHLGSPVYSEGDPLECGSFRAIKILDQAMNVWERVLEVWLKKQVEIDEMQFGFMPGEELLMPLSLPCRNNFWPGIRRYTSDLFILRRLLTGYQGSGLVRNG